MTRQPNLKARVRARMARTGERYADARAHVVANASAAAAAAAASATPTATPAFPAPAAHHLGGVDAETTGLRILLEQAGVGAYSDHLALVVGGGVGMGVFAFHYAAAGSSTLFLAGRHRWDDALAYVTEAARRFGAEPTVEETTSSTKAEAQLRAALERGPAMAWLDLVELGTRGYPAEASGGGYHTLIVYSIDDDAAALVGDLAARPLTVPLETLARARARIGKDRHRLLTLAAATRRPDIPAAIRAGLAATVDGLTTGPRRGYQKSFTLDAVADLADRMTSPAKDGWARVFPRGELLFGALASIHEYVEHYGSGGGLVRPRFAAGLRQAAELTGDRRLTGLADRYGTLGHAWSDLASAALPDEVPLLRRAREAQDRRASLYLERGTDAAHEIAAAWADLGAIRAQAGEDFPLSDAATTELLSDLSGRLRAIHADEVAALEELRAIMA